MITMLSNYWISGFDSNCKLVLTSRMGTNLLKLCQHTNGQIMQPWKLCAEIKLKRLPCHEQHKETHVCKNNWQRHHNDHWFLFQERRQMQHTLPYSSIPCWLLINKCVIYTGHALHLHSKFVILTALLSVGTVEHLFSVPSTASITICQQDNLHFSATKHLFPQPAGWCNGESAVMKLK